MMSRSSLQVVAVAEDAAEPARKSSGKFSGARAGKNCPQKFDPYRERALFPERWSKWCRDNFRTSVQLAAAFQIDDKTARLWMRGDSAPSGWAVDAAKEGLIDNVVPFARERQKARRGRVAA